ncbi:sporulation associated protein [Aspergillus japonicus CBS 114.51]|uniref:Sporulation associated protein n=1 Tax=Aspergillus japonicus CBS 114.51 TaxID=1448312 RepID=A0A8T8X4W3_ASPJA|nr:sporulation associated protein [Aspergillus japonicus CBS 114.51]RAH83187.1 sporulation associated protein [Aspergillus japonicus CBS 114.51]
MAYDPCDCDRPPVHNKPTQELVLCFDGTGNTFRVDGGESNILKIFRMLDRSKENRSGIGTDITPGTFANVAFRPFSNLPASKVIDQALATSFDQHVIGGYRFLARRWRPGSHIYLFGFSRGAYTARFLNEMLDFVGLISADNEELIPFVWQAFLSWKYAHGEREARQADNFLRLCRDTMCRSVGLVHFLGLFDTVNSVAEFNKDVLKDMETMPRPRYMRHAVSIDEKRIKFQPVLFERLRGAHAKKGRVSTWAERAEQQFWGVPLSPVLDTDFEEVYFAGDHSDVGGGHPPAYSGEGARAWPVSQIPLMWMVQEATHVGLTFDPVQLQELGCYLLMEFDPAIVHMAERAPLHDSLEYDSGKGVETLFWRLLECLPMKRPKVNRDGSVKQTRWHVGGLRRPLPDGARIHASVIHRLQQDPEYRPYNLGLGHKRHQIERRDIGQWRRMQHGGLCDYYVQVQGPLPGGSVGASRCASRKSTA